MHPPLKIYICLFLLFLSCPIYTHAENIEFGEISEADGINDFIQVRDRMLKIDNVLINNGDGTLKKGNKSDLKEGDLLQVYIGDKDKKGYWNTIKVILQTEKAKKEILTNTGMKLRHEENRELIKNNNTLKVDTKTSSKGIRFEKGVWRN